MINGRDLILSINGTAVAASKGCSLKVNQNYIKSCSPTDGRTKRKIPTDYDWSVSTDCLVADTAYADSIIDLLTQGTEVTLRWYDTQLHQKRKGQAIIASIDENAPVNSLSTLSITLEGSGSLDKFEEWINISNQCTVDDSELDDESELQQTYSIMPNQIVLHQDPHVEDSVAVFATYISSVGGIGQIGYEIWNIQDIGPVSSERIITQTNPKIVKIYLTDEQDYGYIIVLPDIPTGRQIKVTTISEFQQDNTLQIVAKIYMRSV